MCLQMIISINLINRFKIAPIKDNKKEYNNTVPFFNKINHLNSLDLNAENC